MKNLLLLFYLVALSSITFAQTDKLLIGKDTIYGKITSADEKFIYFIRLGSDQKRSIPYSSINKIYYASGAVVQTASNTQSVNESQYSSNIEKEMPELIFALKNPLPKPMSTDSLNYKIMYVQYNMSRFQKEIKWGSILTTTGLIIAIMPYYYLDIKSTNYLYPNKSITTSFCTTL